jgi:UDP-3-O-[3-hydroxymyristoyl] glucosamine N-acyltransferase
LKIKEIMSYIGGHLVGDPEFEVFGIGTIDNITSGDLVFLFHQQKIAGFISSIPDVIVCREGMDIQAKNLIFVENPRLAFIQLLPKFYTQDYPEPGIHPTAFIHPQARVGERVSIGAGTHVESDAIIADDTIIFPQVYIGKGSQIGKSCLIFPQTVIRENCILGDRVILQSGVIIGGDGFGYERSGDVYLKVPHVGKVVLEDDVEVGANSTIDRATLGETRIGAGTKIDNLVMIAHNVKIGKNCIIVAQCGIAGSSSLGDDVIMAGQCGVVDHGKIGNRVRLAARTGVVNSIPDDQMVSGFPAQDHKIEMKEKVLLRKLPDLWQRIKNLEKKVFKS